MSEFPIGCCTDTLFEYPTGVTDENPPPPPPGDQLRGVLISLEVVATKKCRCDAIRREMNRLGVEGCRQKKTELLAELRKGYDESSLATKLNAARLALANGLPLSLEGLFDLAVERATLPPDSGS